jgi:hypothetical protein
MGKSHKKQEIIMEVNQVEFRATIEGLHVTMLFTDLKMMIDLMGTKLKLKPQEPNEIPL